MISQRTKRAFFMLLFLVALVVVAAASYGYLLSRDPGFDLENPNVVEANQFHRKLKLYTNSVANDRKGYVRLSQLEINSYIRQSLTNKGDTNANGMHLKKMGIGLTLTNFTLYSWGEYKFMKLSLPFVLQRAYQLTQDGTNQWQTPFESLKIGHVEIPDRLREKIEPFLEQLDAPIRDRFSWTTNIQAALITKNELSQRPELRLYTYKPIPAEDLH